MAKKKPKEYCKGKDINQKTEGNNNGFSRVSVEMQKHPSFQSLTANALRILVWCIFKNFKTATSKRVIDTSKRVFKFTYLEAQNDLGMSRPTFSRAKNELIKKGFLECTAPGGLRGVNGIASEYSLSNKWKKWKPPIKRPNDMKKARAEKGKK